MSFNRQFLHGPGRLAGASQRKPKSDSIGTRFTASAQNRILSCRCSAQAQLRGAINTFSTSKHDGQTRSGGLFDRADCERLA